MLRANFAFRIVARPVLAAPYAARPLATIAEAKKQEKEALAARKEALRVVAAEKKAATKAWKAALRARKQARLLREKSVDAARRKALRERNAEKAAAEKAKAQQKKQLERERAKGRRREPGSPVMPRTPVAFYIKEKMTSANVSGDVAAVRETLGKAAREFSQLLEDQKRPYLDMAEADKKRYEQEYAAWRAANPAAPPRPASPYIRFANTVRAQLKSENPDKSITELAKLTAERWRALSEAEKQSFTDATASEMAKWSKQYAAWKAKTQA